MRPGHWLLFGALTVLLLSVLVGAAAALTLGLVRPWVDPAWLQGVTIWIDGERFTLPRLDHLDATQVALGAAAVTGTLLLVVPLALMMALGGLVIGMLAGTLSVVLVLLVSFSPLLLLGWLLWWALRPGPNNAPPQKVDSPPTGRTGPSA